MRRKEQTPTELQRQQFELHYQTATELIPKAVYWLLGGMLTLLSIILAIQHLLPIN